MNHYEYWGLLRTLRAEYNKQYTGYYEPSDTGKSDSFDKYIEEQYGIRMFIHNDGKIDEKDILRRFSDEKTYPLKNGEENNIFIYLK